MGAFWTVFDDRCFLRRIRGVESLLEKLGKYEKSFTAEIAEDGEKINHRFPRFYPD